MDRYIKHLNKISQDIRKKPLSTLECDVIKLVLQGCIYSEISQQLAYDCNYIGDVAREIYGLIGQKYKVKVIRANLRNVLETIFDTEPDETFNICHNIKPHAVLHPQVISFSEDAIMIDVSTYWKLDVINKALILKAQHPIVFNLDGLTHESLGRELLQLSNRQQISSNAILELLKILNTFFNKV